MAAWMPGHGPPRCQCVCWGCRASFLLLPHPQTIPGGCPCWSCFYGAWEEEWEQGPAHCRLTVLGPSAPFLSTGLQARRTSPFFFLNVYLNAQSMGLVILSGACGKQGADGRQQPAIVLHMPLCSVHPSITKLGPIQINN